MSLTAEQYFWLSTQDVTPPPPVIPTRDQVCAVKITFSGLTITTSAWGAQPWFEPLYQAASDADRASIRQQKIAAGDTHQIIEFFTNDQYPGRFWWTGVTIPSGEHNPQQFLGFVQELRQDGLIPLVVFDGDNGDNPVDGYPNALRQLPILVELLKDYNDQVLYGRLWDGVFYGSTPANIQNFGTQFRALLPNGYLAIEHQPGRIPVGNGPADYQPGGMMTGYDVIMGEFDYPGYGVDSTWQVLGRMLQPYHRPPDQPVHDDPSPPFYLASPSPRGPYFYIPFEIGEYQWVQNQTSRAELEVAGTYFRNMGGIYTCLP